MLHGRHNRLLICSCDLAKLVIDMFRVRTGLPNTGHIHWVIVSCQTLDNAPTKPCPSGTSLSKNLERHACPRSYSSELSSQEQHTQAFGLCSIGNRVERVISTLNIGIPGVHQHIASSWIFLCDLFLGFYLIRSLVLRKEILDVCGVSPGFENNSSKRFTPNPGNWIYRAVRHRASCHPRQRCEN